MTPSWVGKPIHQRRPQSATTPPSAIPISYRIPDSSRICELIPGHPASNLRGDRMCRTNHSPPTSQP
jgi:hypothetical protein